MPKGSRPRTKGSDPPGLKPANVMITEGDKVKILDFAWRKLFRMKRKASIHHNLPRSRSI